LLRHKGSKANTIGITVVIEADKEELKEQLNSLINQAPIDPRELAKFIPNRASEKYDLFLSDDLMCADYAASKLDVVGALETLKDLLGGF